MADIKKTRGLGRGLSALMADVGPEPTSAAVAPARPDLIVPIEKVFPNPDQPRRSFTADHLEDLSASIKAKGIIQPLIVRKRASGNGEFEIVAGERRWRAAQMAQLHEIPVLVREFTDTEVLEVAIIENVQRADLNPVEEAAGYRQLMDKFGHTQEKLASELGKSRSHIANLMRLLQLPDDVQELLVAGKLSAGHARALITSEDPSALAKQVVAQGLSVRATEALAKRKTDGEASTTKARPRGLEKDADTKALENDLSAAIGMSVEVQHKSGGETGQVLIKYASLDQLDEICRILSIT
ncbi:ParB/RepB/Spo0J family partition protein [Planktotalea sp.]|uniref:ParB/RepB/Spo0J family partition protein n=1 Tax=Planktotalea sp. TaxID=2029877 RepID=UPI002600F317|nr:ParB/RepB/Spo0J family partition protein [Planktotalea sp.]